MRLALVCLFVLACGGDDAAAPDAAVVPDAAASSDDACGAPDVTLRVVNLCASAVDVYVGGQSQPLFANVQPGDVTPYLGTMLYGTLEVHHAGDAQPLATSDLLSPAEGDQATVALRGNNCSPMALWEGFGDTQPGFLRIRFVDTLGRDTPTRLYLENGDGVFHQVAAVAPLGDSGREGALVPVAPMDRASVRAQVGPELSSTPGTPGYQIPTSVLYEGATLFVFNRQLALFILAFDGPPPALPSGIVRVNPSVALLNGASDLCGTAASHFAFSDSSGNALAALDIRYGQEGRLVLPPTTGGHSITASCNGGPGRTVATGPLEAGQRYLQILFGSQILSTSDRPPATLGGPGLVFANAVVNAPPLDVQTRDATGNLTTIFTAVAPGTLADWIAAPAQDYDLVLLERPAVSASFSGGQPAFVVAIGDWNGQVRLITHRVQ